MHCKVVIKQFCCDTLTFALLFSTCSHQHRYIWRESERNKKLFICIKYIKERSRSITFNQKLHGNFTLSWFSSSYCSFSLPAFPVFATHKIFSCELYTVQCQFSFFSVLNPLVISPGPHFVYSLKSSDYRILITLQFLSQTLYLHIELHLQYSTWIH